MRILVVEDEPVLCQQLVVALKEQGYTVDSTESGREGEYLGNEYPVSVAVLDLGLPDLDGLEVLRRWRKAGRSFPVLILTARGRWQEKVEGLEAGADDYLVKPFQMEEVLARLRALVRRSNGWSNSILHAGNLELDLAQKTVKIAGKTVELTAFEYSVLEYLTLNAGKVISKAKLVDHLYEMNEEPPNVDNVLEVVVGRLRRKLDPKRTLQPIETLRGQGYRLRLERTDG